MLIDSIACRNGKPVREGAGLASAFILRLNARDGSIRRLTDSGTVIATNRLINCKPLGNRSRSIVSFSDISIQNETLAATL